MRKSRLCILMLHPELLLWLAIVVLAVLIVRSLFG